MDYKKKIIDMLDCITNETFIEMIYGFVRRLCKENEERKDFIL